MRATVGDRVVIASTHVDDPVREGVVEEVRGTDGTPPWMVRWGASEEPTLFFPGPDAHVAPAEPAGG